MSFSLRSMSPDLILSAVVSGLTCYALSQIEPVPDPTFLITVSVVNACVRLLIENLLDIKAYDLTKKYGYIDKDNRITNPKFFYLRQILTIASVFLTTIFYYSIGKTMGYQTPSYIHIFGYLSLTSASVWFTKRVINFISYSYYGKLTFAYY